MESRNKTIALQFIKAMGTADAALAIPCLTPDAYTVTKGFGHFAGTRSCEVMLGTIAAFPELLPGGLKLEVLHVTEGENRVIVECVGNATTITNEPYHNEYCFIFTMRDGLIAKIEEYFCSVLADRVLWPLMDGHNDGALRAELR